MKSKKAKKDGPHRKRLRGPHHIIPTSRQRRNIYPDERWLPESEKHTYWHELFSNLTPREVVAIITKYMNDNGDLNDDFFSISFTVENPLKRGISAGVKTHKHKSKIPKRKEAWRIVFGNMSGLEAIEWIEREFIRKEWLKN